MNSQENLNPPAERPSFFGMPPNSFLLAGLGARFWGGLLAGIGIGLFVAKSLDELGIFKLVWVGFVAVALIGTGQGIAFKAVRREFKPNAGKLQNS